MVKPTTSKPYHSLFTVKQISEFEFIISFTKSCRIKGSEDISIADILPNALPIRDKEKTVVHSSKLNNNISRACSTVREYVLCNSWDYWITFTLDASKHDRFDIDSYIKKFGRFINDFNKIHGSSVKYLVIPEKHNNGAWHMHGFLSGIPEDTISRNSNGYLQWDSYVNKFGFMSMDYIKDIQRASSYCLKYMTKNIDKNITERGKRLFYSSHGLKRAEVIYQGDGIFNPDSCPDIDWDYVHPDGYCYTKKIDIRQIPLSSVFIKK